MKKPMVGFRMDPELIKIIDKYAEEQGGISRTDAIMDLIKKGFEYDRIQNENKSENDVKRNDNDYNPIDAILRIKKEKENKKYGILKYI